MRPVSQLFNETHLQMRTPYLDRPCQKSIDDLTRDVRAKRTVRCLNV